MVYCNCDDPRVSNFFHYFSYNFEKLGLKKLIATCYKNQNIDLIITNKATSNSTGISLKIIIGTIVIKKIIKKRFSLGIN